MKSLGMLFKNALAYIIIFVGAVASAYALFVFGSVIFVGRTFPYSGAGLGVFNLFSAYIWFFFLKIINFFFLCFYNYHYSLVYFFLNVFFQYLCGIKVLCVILFNFLNFFLIVLFGLFITLFLILWFWILEVAILTLEGFLILPSYLHLDLTSAISGFNIDPSPFLFPIGPTGLDDEKVMLIAEIPLAIIMFSFLACLSLVYCLWLICLWFVYIFNIIFVYIFNIVSILLLSLSIAIKHMWCYDFVIFRIFGFIVFISIILLFFSCMFMLLFPTHTEKIYAKIFGYLGDNLFSIFLRFRILSPFRFSRDSSDFFFSLKRFILMIAQYGKSQPWRFESYVIFLSEVRIDPKVFGFNLW